jgi:hypothetical protein
MIFLSGPGLFIMNNTGSIIQSLNNGIEDHNFVFKCIFTLSISNMCGRLITGGSDWSSFKRGFWLVIAGKIKILIFFIVFKKIILIVFFIDVHFVFYVLYRSFDGYFTFLFCIFCKTKIR